MKEKFKISLLLIILLMGLSCEDYLVEEPPSFIAANDFWQTASDARTGVDGIYRIVNDVHFRWMAAVDSFTDDQVCKSGGSPFINSFGTHTVTPSDRIFEQVDVYTGWWTGISRANTALKFVPDINMDETEKNIILGEARALRAFLYYNLVKLYGDLPMLTDAIESTEDFDKPRTDAETIYNEIIIPDLQFAENNCREGLHTDGHFTKWTAKIILADVYLTRAGYRRTSRGEFVQGDAANWALARDKAKEILDDSPHALNTVAKVDGANITPAFGVAWDYQNPFTPEAMLELSYIKVINLGSWYSRECNPHVDGRQYWGPQNQSPLLDSEGIDLTVAQMDFLGTQMLRAASYIPTPDLYDAFEDGDERRDFSLMTRYNSADGRTFLCQPTFRKLIDIEYFLGGEETNFRYTTANLILYRYADALLIYAEAQNEADGTPNAQAYAAINEIRNRAGLEDLTPGLSQDDFRQAVWQERRVELNAEFKRKFDLMRTNRLVAETTDINLDWTAAQGSLTDYRNAYTPYYNGRPPFPDYEWLWPIPQSEMDLNVFNDWYQNEGYVD
ncbi:RagB/SusD family nutrient uptake outer membrane protein [Flagellimonas eckloniae]|uniref:RagB/SusD family nutrient uptake outer membrane protein n=1 Tax=Flagellimonas eckloniae TaxID=346185 RepID=A0A0Q1H574_9FLAO|nr:RagB/SusD family nutrient uptake outer membrane protein [Allomuricauda eckloniae]KQC28674.1 hypothetical protein AAY42_01215 [Allomuricauda eckloniae]